MKNKLMFSILFVFFLNEIVTLLYSYSNTFVKLITNVVMIVSFGLTFLLLSSLSKNRFVSYFNYLFVALALLNLLFFEKYNQFNFSTFTLGTLLYVTCFVWVNVYQLKKENMSFYSSNEFRLLFAPLILFVGYSLIFSFRNYSVSSVKVINNIELFTIISYLTNIVYYSLINIYIYKEIKQRR